MRTGTYKIRNGYDVTVPGRRSHAFYDAKKKAWFQDYDHTVPAKPLEIGEKVQYYLFFLECINGGWGWGKTGQRSLMSVAGRNKKEAEKELKQQIPGGWRYKYLRKTDSGGLEHI